MGTLCHFPFEYKGMKHYECITDDSHGWPWCSSTSKYSFDTFGYCDCPNVTDGRNSFNKNTLFRKTFLLLLVSNNIKLFSIRFFVYSGWNKQSFSICEKFQMPMYNGFGESHEAQMNCIKKQDCSYIASPISSDIKIYTLCNNESKIVASEVDEIYVKPGNFLLFVVILMRKRLA